MDFRIQKIERTDFPSQLLEIPQIPESLYVVGEKLDPDAFYLCVVGSRNHTTYGKDVCQKLIAGLAGSPIVIVSGLALGIDTIAHKTAINIGLKTIAFPGSGLGEKVLYPATNLSLAKEILASGGTLVSEFEPSFRATQWSFPRRNRIMAGICHAVLIIEAEEKSGTLITARMALDYNREVFAVPGPINSTNSIGTNELIRTGATPVFKSEHILEFFGLTNEEKNPAQELPLDLSDEEKQILEILNEPQSRDTIIDTFDVPAHEINILLSAMEIKGLIKEEYGEIRRV
jgi:DNA processing protein